MSKKILVLSTDQIKQCEEFALRSAETHTSHYARRGQTNKDKVLKDIKIGKQGEVGLYTYMLVSIFGLPTEPDFEIYKGKRKKFGADLFFNTKYTQFPIHVKTQDIESAKKYGQSYLFQYNGRGFGHTDKIFKSYDDKELFAAVEVNDSIITIHGVWRLKDIFEADLFKEPRLRWFHGVKKALYLDDIKKSGIEDVLDSLITGVGF